MHRLFFYTLLLLLPVQLGYHFWPDFAFVNGVRIDYLAPTVYFTDLIILGILGSWTWSTKVDHYKFWIVITIVAIISLFAQIPLLSFLKALTLLKLFLLGLYIFKTKPNLNIAVSCLLVAVGYSCFIAWLQFINQSSLNGILWFLGERTFVISTPGIATAIMQGKLILRPYATFPHPNVLAGFLTTLLPFILLTQFKNKLLQKAKIPFLVFVLATLFITFSRSAWLIAGVILIMAVIVVPISNRLYLSQRVFVMIGVVFIIFLPFLSERFVNLLSVDQQSITRRITLNTAAIEMIKDHPLFGVGLNNFIPLLPAYTTISSYQDLQPAHNIYLLIAAETGIIGLGLTVWLFYFLAKLRITNYELLFPVGTLLLLGLFDHYPYTIHQMQLLLAILVGLILSRSVLLKHETG